MNPTNRSTFPARSFSGAKKDGARAGWPDEFGEKIAQNVAQSIFCQNYYIGTFYCIKSSPTIHYSKHWKISYSSQLL
jgi:hypothetical protein